MGIFNPLERGFSGKQKMSLLLYLIFLSASVWATGESMARSTDLPKLICYTMGLSALLVASYSLTLIKKSFSLGYVSNQKTLLLTGLIGFSILWSISLTSNTHNFYYVAVINDLRQNEIREVRNQLELLEESSVTSFNNAKAKFNNEVENEISNMVFEIKNVGDPGHGIRTDSIIDRLEDLLDTKIDRLKASSNSTNALRAHAQQMAAKVREITDTKLSGISTLKEKLNKFLSQDKFNATIISLDDMIENYPQKKEEEIVYGIRNSYAFYNKCYEYVEKLFENPFLKSNTHFKVKELPSPPQSVELENIGTSWKWFLRGEFQAQHFWLALLWAVAIDIACFILFYFGVLPSSDDD